MRRVILLCLAASTLGARVGVPSVRAPRARPCATRACAAGPEQGGEARAETRASERAAGGLSGARSAADLAKQLRSVRNEQLGEAREMLVQSASLRFEQLVRFKDEQLVELRAKLSDAFGRIAAVEAAAARAAEGAAAELGRAMADAERMAMQAAARDAEAAQRLAAAELRLADSEAAAAERLAAADKRLAAAEAAASERLAAAGATIGSLEALLAQKALQEREARGRVTVLELSRARLEGEMGEMRTRTAELGEQVKALLSAKHSLEDALEYAQDDLRSSGARASAAEADAANSARKFALASARSDALKAELRQVRTELQQVSWQFDEYRFDAEKVQRARLARRARLETRADLNRVETASNRRAVANALRALLQRVTPGPVRRLLKLAPRRGPSADEQPDRSALEAEERMAAQLLLESFEGGKRL
ncbi:hypothetical protein KFE25_008423 [Diacronema lutheri]|uniref:Cilia- and flagella-associated protein 157 n=2 Tax=Diacronema lutheri TaxID=2081491 RepID=A0A8J5X555_DIALT|nr:hypothetical protein KFE25_008423 [Diacronema lutheri]